MKNKTLLLLFLFLFSQSYFLPIQAQSMRGMETSNPCGQVTITISGNQIFYTGISSAVQRIRITKADSKTTMTEVAVVCSSVAEEKRPCKGNLQTEKLEKGTYQIEVTYFDGKKKIVCEKEIRIEAKESTICNIYESPYASTQINSLRTYDWSTVEFPADPNDWPGNTEFRNLYGFGLDVDHLPQVDNQATPQEMLNIANGQLNFFLPPYVGECDSDFEWVTDGDCDAADIEDCPDIMDTHDIDFRSEIRIHQRLPLGTKQWFGWTYTFGDNYLIDIEKTSIFQIHPGSGYSPQFNLELSDGGGSNDGEVDAGELEVITNTTLDGVHDGNIKKRTYITPQAGQSLDFVVYIKYGTKGAEGTSTDEDGQLIVWINGQIVYSGKVATAHCYAQYGGNAKWGIYHPTWGDDPCNVLNSINALTDDQGVLHGLRLAMDDLRIVTRRPGDPDYGINAFAMVNPGRPKFSPLQFPCACSGTPCDDGDPTTINDIEDGRCNCQGIHQICEKIDMDEGDGVEQNNEVDLKSHCIDLGNGIIGLRFPDMPGMETRKIQSAYIQFTSAALDAQTGQVDLEILAADTGNNPHREFQETDNDISNRVDAQSSSIGWTISSTWQCHDDETQGEDLENCDETPNLDDPCDDSSDLECRGENGPAQRTPDLTDLVQEIVNSDDYAINNDLVFIIRPNGSNFRSIMSFDRSIDNAPELCIRFSDESGLPGNPNDPIDIKKDRRKQVDNADLQFQINPNPITQEFEIITTISIPGSTIQVFNVNGQLIKTIETATAAQSKIDASSWSPGMYYFLLHDGQKQYSQKVIKL